MSPPKQPSIVLSEPAPEKITAFTPCGKGCSAQTSTENEKVNCCCQKLYGRSGKVTVSPGAEGKKCVCTEQPPGAVALCSPPPHSTEGTLLSDCWAGTEPSCFSAVCMEQKQKETICTLLTEHWLWLFSAGVAWEDAGTEQRGRLAPPCRAVCHCLPHVSLISQQQHSLSLQGKEQAQISPLEAAGPGRLLARVTLKTGEMRSRAELPVRDSRPGLSQKKSELKTIKKTADFDFSPFICWFDLESREIISSEVQTRCTCIVWQTETSGHLKILKCELREHFPHWRPSIISVREVQGSFARNLTLLLGQFLRSTDQATQTLWGKERTNQEKELWKKTTLTLCPLCWDFSATRNLTMASHLARVWGSQAVTTRISCLEGTCRWWAA